MNKAWLWSHAVFGDFKLNVWPLFYGLILLWRIFPRCNFSKFHKKSIVNFFFLLMLQLYHLLQGCQLSVCTQGFWSFRPPALFLCTSNLPPRSPSPVLCCVWTRILYSPRPLPWLSSSTHQHCLPDGHLWPELCGNFGVFIIQRPCSLCCFSEGGAKVCVWLREMQSWHSVTDRESFKIPKSTSPPLFVPVQEGIGEITQESSCVCVCTLECVPGFGALVSVCGLAVHIYECVHAAWAATHSFFMRICVLMRRAEWLPVDFMM